MNKTILVGLAILTASTSAASAWTHRPHSQSIKPNASAATMNPKASARSMNANAAMGAPPAAATPSASPAMPGASSQNHDMYMKNLHDSGYDPKNDYTKSGTVARE
jgi:hypothetical protein